MLIIRYRYVLGASYLFSSGKLAKPGESGILGTIFSLNKVQMKVMLKKINSVLKCSTIDKKYLSYLYS